MLRKRGQVTIFVIIAVIIVAVVIVIFLLRSSQKIQNVPSNIEPAYTSFLSCLQDQTNLGISLLEAQGGYIDLPAFSPGSLYMPFSSQMDFGGVLVPYWYYVTGNNLQREQIPSRASMQIQLQNFIDERVSSCNFNSFIDEGYVVDEGEPHASVVIEDSNVKVNLGMDLSITKEDQSSLINTHEFSVKSNLGKLYNDALKVYNEEQSKLFLEKYAVDTVRLYAPVDGVEFSCGPLFWNADDVFYNLSLAVESNTLSLKSKGKSNDYFVVDLPVSNGVRFLNSRSWPASFEVNPSEGRMLRAMPVGNQPGLGILGFCYVPYHFVYDLRYSVLIQVYNEDEIFQFPVAVVVQGNKERKALVSSASEVSLPEVCQYKNTQISVGVYDIRNRPVEADISYDCGGSSCYIGQTKNGKISEMFPQCVNGRIVARAEGYEDAKETFSSLQGGSTNILINKVYPLNINLKVDGKTYAGDAIIVFNSNDSSRSVAYPEQKTLDISQGDYEVTAYVYKNSSLKFEATSGEQCVDVPQSGIGGVLGLTEKKCVNVNTPEQVISNVLVGGGKENYYFSNSQLENSKSIEINTDSLPTPDSLDSLQVNYILFEDRGLDINVK